jgi:hypothetical protein
MGIGKITAKDRWIWKLLKDPNYRVTERGEILYKGPHKARGRRGWRAAGWISPSRHGTKIYRRIQYRGVQLYAHRIVWAFFRGFLSPNQTINHKDLNGLNNAIENLELVTASVNTKHARAAYRTNGLTAAELRKNWKRGSKCSQEFAP